MTAWRAPVVCSTCREGLLPGKPRTFPQTAGKLRAAIGSASKTLVLCRAPCKTLIFLSGRLPSNHLRKCRFNAKGYDDAVGSNEIHASSLAREHRHICLRGKRARVSQTNS